MNEADSIQALIQLHGEQERQGPGDLAFSLSVLERIQDHLPQTPRVADLGCGTGVSSLFLARSLKTQVRAVDLSEDFLKQLVQRAAVQGLADLIVPIAADMGQLNWEKHSLDLLWSEGAAYNLTFQGALQAWRPLLKTGGLAVISELSYFTQEAPEAVKAFWQEAYPALATEAENRATAQASGFEVLEIRRLPTQAWWQNYYNPLKAQMQRFAQTENTALQAVIKETQCEMDLFADYAHIYGYSFYILKAL